MARPWKDSLPNIRRHPLMVGNVLASFPLRKSRAKDPIDEEPIPLVRMTSRPPPPSKAIELRKRAKEEAPDGALTLKRTLPPASDDDITLKKSVPPAKEGVEIVGPGMFRVPVSDDAVTNKVSTRPPHRDAIPPAKLPAFDIDSVESFELVMDSSVAEEEPLTVPKRAISRVPPEWDDSSVATAELKSPEELKGDNSKSHISIKEEDILTEEMDLKSPEELRRSTRPPFTGEVPEDQPLFSLIPGQCEEEDDGIDSVNRCLQDLEEIEIERQLVELEEQERQEQEEKRIELLRVLSEKRKKMEAELKEKEEANKKAAAEEAAREKQRIAEAEAKKAEEEKLAKEQAAQSDETEEEIHVEVEYGILWDDEHTAHRLSEDEVAICEPALPNRQRRYILQVPEDGESGADLVKMALKNEDKVRIAGKSYYIMDSEFAGAKIVARVGNILHVWPSAVTSYEFLGRIGVDTPEYDEVEWPKSFGLTVRPEEKEMAYGLIPENMPRLLHPVPAPYTKNPYNLKIMNECAETPIIDIDGREYYVLEPESVASWREIVITLKDVRMVDRSGDSINVWSRDFNGHSLFSCEKTCHLGSYGQPGAPMLPKERGFMIEPYNAEVIDVATVYADGQKRRYLYPMPEKISEMDADMLRSIMAIASGYIEKEKHSPLISLHGRWYMALEYAWQDARESSYEGGMVRIHKERSANDSLEKLRAHMERKKEENTPPVVNLPSDPEQRVRLMQKFPEHASRYMLAVGPEVQTEVPDVWIKNGDGVTRYLVFEEPVQGAFEVRRIKDDIRRV
jgi:hypothetical protein